MIRNSNLNQKLKIIQTIDKIYLNQLHVLFGLRKINLLFDVS